MHFRHRKMDRQMDIDIVAKVRDVIHLALKITLTNYHRQTDRQTDKQMQDLPIRGKNKEVVLQLSGTTLVSIDKVTLR